MTNTIHLRMPLRAVFVMLVAVLMSVPAWAQSSNLVVLKEKLEGGSGGTEAYSGFAAIDNIYYNLDGKAATAEVTYKDDNFKSYSGDVTIPEKVSYQGMDYTVTTIGEHAFYNCFDLTSVSLPATVIDICNWAFENCSGLTSFTVPKTVTAMGLNPFVGCNGLTSLSVENGNPKYDSRNFCEAIINTERNVLVSACNATNIPNGVKELGFASFAELQIQSVWIPSSVETINAAFYHCTKLASVTFSEGLKTIESQSFYHCYSLTELQLPEGLETIGSSAFFKCSSLSVISIPKSVTKIGNQAFYDCTRINTIFSSMTEPCEIDEYCFYNDRYNNATLCVPAGTKPVYEATKYWSKFEKIVDESEVVKYPVWVGSMQVNNMNANDVLGDGNVSYTPGEGCGTLTFKQSVAINGMYNSAKISSDGIDLTINAPNGLVIENSTFAINLGGSKKLTFNGNLTVKTNAPPLYGCSDITINGDLTSDGSPIGLTNFTVNGNANMTGSPCVSASGAVVLNGTKHELNGMISAGTFTITGDLTASASNCPAILASGDITLVSGTLTLDGGNWSGIESEHGNIIIPDGYEIREPKGGKFEIKEVYNRPTDNTSRVVVDANGNMAGHVVIGPHVHELEAVDAVNPTCTEPGTAAYWECKKCQKLYADENAENEITAPEEIPALGHDWGEWVVTREAEPGKPGEETRTCLHDPSHKETRPIYSADFTAPTAKENLVYTGETQALVEAGTAEGGEMLYSVNNETWSTDIPTATEAGDYTVYFKVVGDNDHKDVAAQSLIVSIAKANVTVTAPTAKEDLVYSGEAQALIATGKAEGGEMQYSADNETWSTTVPTATEAGDYTVYYKVIADKNHNDVEAHSLTISIAKADVTVTAPTAKENLVYSGEAQALIEAGSAEGGEMQYSADNKTWSPQVPTATEAGDYTVYYKVVADKNHNDVEAQSLTISIAKADVTMTAPTAKENLVYSGEAQALIEAGSAEGGEMQYSADNKTWSPQIPTATEAGDYTVYYKVAADNDHNDVETQSLTVSIAKADVTLTAPTAKENLVENGEAQALIEAGSAEGGEMQYSLDGKTWSTDVPTATKAGDYTVYYKVVADKNHNDVEAQSLTVTIAMPDGLKSLTLDADTDNWYDINGHKLDGKPTKKGLYIRNGAKVVIK